MYACVCIHIYVQMHALRNRYSVSKFWIIMDHGWREYPIYTPRWNIVFSSFSWCFNEHLQFSDVSKEAENFYYDNLECHR